jgi:hypothetical protein
MSLHRKQLRDGGIAGLLLQVEQRMLGVLVAALPVWMLCFLVVLAVMVVLRHSVIPSLG